MDGHALKVHGTSKRTVAAGTPLLTIGESSRLEAVVDVLAADAVKIQPGQIMLMTGWGGNEVLRAGVRLVEPVAFTKVSALGVEEQRVNVIADPIDPLGPLGDGYRIQARVIGWEEADAVKLPGSSVFRAGGERPAATRQEGKMVRRIVLLQGHPDNTRPHLCHALADAYEKGASAAGHAVRRVDVAALDFPLLRSQQEWEHGSLPAGLADAQEAIGWSNHLVLFFPLWLGDMPALFKGFLEQVARPGFAFHGERNAFTAKGLKGRSARVIVTMGMPAIVYRWYFRAHSVKSLERNILGFVGIAPVDETLIGMAGNLKNEDAQKWLSRMEELGRRGH